MAANCYGVGAQEYISLPTPTRVYLNSEFDSPGDSMAVPSLQPPAPHHFDKPVVVTVFSG